MRNKTSVVSTKIRLLLLIVALTIRASVAAPSVPKKAVVSAQILLKHLVTTN